VAQVRPTQSPTQALHIPVAVAVLVTQAAPALAVPVAVALAEQLTAQTVPPI
jgi:hypothetical protein